MILESRYNTQVSGYCCLVLRGHSQEERGQQTLAPLTISVDVLILRATLRVATENRIRDSRTTFSRPFQVGLGRHTRCHPRGAYKALGLGDSGRSSGP